jgi:long-chain acyl-CoA synthetase
VQASLQNFCQRVVCAANLRPDKVAMTMLGATTEHLTFGSMLKEVRSIAYRLMQESVAFGDRVAIIGENHPNWAIAYLGILYRGAVATPLDPAASKETLARFLSHSGTKLAFVSVSSLSKFHEACALIGKEIRAVVFQQSRECGTDSFADWAATPFPDEFADAPPSLIADDLALLMYTSGTTGLPKGVQLTHGNILAQITGVERVMNISEDEVVLSILPLFHAYSQVVNLWLAAIIGARVVYLNQLGSTEIEAAMKTCGATTLIGVPRLWYLFHSKIFDAVRAKPAPLRWLFRVMLIFSGLLRDLANLNVGAICFRRVHRAFGGRLRLAVSGGANFDQAVASDFHRLGFTILQGYGLTETSGAVTATRFEDNRIGSVGTPIDGVEVRINDPGEDSVGEILIRGPIVTSGYYRNPEADRDAFTCDKWFRSGDLGRFDKEGHLYIVGRKKDVIILSSGKNVFPEDVEAHYERSPLVSEICVIGKRDLTNQFEHAETLTAIVIPNFEFLRTQQISNPGEWLPWELEDLGRQIPEYQRVHDFVVRTEPLPRTTTRKVRRFELKQELEAANNSGSGPRNGNGVVLSSASKQLMNSPTGRIVSAIINQCAVNIEAVHPQQNLEIDLRLDSLARIECITQVEQVLGIRFDPSETTSLLTVGDVIELACRKTSELNNGNSLIKGPGSRSKSQWQEILNDNSGHIPELQPLLKRRRLTPLLAYLMLRAIYFVARAALGVEVTGSDVLRRLKPPYLICPNHQSYIDPFLVCSILPRSALGLILHVGASRYFTGLAKSQLARLINVVPIDPDKHLLRAMRAGAAIMREGRILNVYPEGRRSFDGKLGVFKKGAAILATELNVPIVPVTLDGTYQIWPRGSSRIRFAKVTIAFGEPIAVDKVTLGITNDDERYEKVTAVLKDRVQRMLEEIRLR